MSFVREVPSAKADSDKKSQCADAVLKARSTKRTAGDAGLQPGPTGHQECDDAELKLGSTWRVR